MSPSGFRRAVKMYIAIEPSQSILAEIHDWSRMWCLLSSEGKVGWVLVLRQGWSSRNVRTYGTNMPYLAISGVGRNAGFGVCERSTAWVPAIGRSNGV